MNGCFLQWFLLTDFSPLLHLAGIKAQQRPGRLSKVGLMSSSWNRTPCIGRPKTTAVETVVIGRGLKLCSYRKYDDAW